MGYVHWMRNSNGWNEDVQGGPRKVKPTTILLVTFVLANVLLMFCSVIYRSYGDLQLSSDIAMLNR